MKIRTRLLLFLLPTLIASIALVSTLLSFNWHKEIVEGFRTKLRSAVITTADLAPTDEQLEKIQKQLQVTDLYFLPLDQVQTDMIPKSLHITPIYQTEEGEKLMTGYSPVYDANGHIKGLMGADINVSLIDKKFQDSLFLIILCAGFTILVMIVTLFIIANKIARPVTKLNNSALAIAAGQYGESITVKGPKEIAELSNTLSTMSECLHENINRLKENSYIRERMYGEYESSILLQHMMLQKNIDDCKSDAIGVKPITFFSEDPKGFLLDFPKTSTEETLLIELREAEEEGFEGMYQLLTEHKLSKSHSTHSPVQEITKNQTQLLLNTESNTLTHQGPHIPFFFSLEKQTLIPIPNQTTPLESGDYFILFNQGLSRFIPQDQIEKLLTKVLKIFSADGLETTAAMLQKELSFLTKRKTLPNDLHLLCFQALNI